MKQGQSEQIAQYHVQSSLKHLQGQRPQNTSEYPVPVFDQLHRKKEKVSLKQNFLCFSLCPLPLVLSLGTTGKWLAPFSLHPPFRYVYTQLRSPWALLFSRLNRLCCFSLSLYGRCFSPLTIFVGLCWVCSSMPLFLLYRGTQTGHSTPHVTSPAELREKVSVFSLLSTLYLMQPQCC